MLYPTKKNKPDKPTAMIGSWAPTLFVIFQ